MDERPHHEIFNLLFQMTISKNPGMVFGEVLKKKCFALTSSPNMFIRFQKNPILLF